MCERGGDPGEGQLSQPGDAGGLTGGSDTNRTLMKSSWPDFSNKGEGERASQEEVKTGANSR